MDWLTTTIGAETLEHLEETLNLWVFGLGLVLLGIELIRYRLRAQLDWTLVGDTATNFVTSILFSIVTFILFLAFYIAGLSFAAQFAIFDIETNLLTVIACIILADFTYYWEHRFSHRVAIAWATHTVHHSSPHFNISVAYRFGPMDAFWTVFFIAPLVLLGFDFTTVIFAEACVLIYQTFLHTETIGKLPRPIEAVFNTPSHHRVHHGQNPEYIDKNYGGMLIIWDRLFGTFAKEKEPVVFGITDPVNSVNPFVVFLHGLTRLWRQAASTEGWGNRLVMLFKPPGDSKAT